jgi:hypothetical protein
MKKSLFVLTLLFEFLSIHGFAAKTVEFHIPTTNGVGVVVASYGWWKKMLTDDQKNIENLYR